MQVWVGFNNKCISKCELRISFKVIYYSCAGAWNIMSCNMEVFPKGRSDTQNVKAHNWFSA